MSAVSGVNLEQIRSGMLSQEDWETLITRTKELNELPIFIVSDAPRDIEELCAHVEKQVIDSEAKIVYIDYLHFLDYKNSNTVENRYQEVSMFCRSLKALTRKLNIPIVVTSQLNRKPEERQEKYDKLYKRPNMYDLRDSGTICEDSNLVFLISRPELIYHGDVDSEGNNIKGLAEIIVAKHNNGPTDTVALNFNKNTCAFSNRNSEDWF